MYPSSGTEFYMNCLILDIPNCNGAWAIASNPGALIRYATCFNPDCKDDKDPGSISCGDGRFIVTGVQKSYAHNLVLIPKGDTKYVIQKGTMDTFFDCVLSKSNIYATRIQHVYYKWKCTEYHKQK